MEEQLPGLELPLPDQETFERVWKRVMPDQSLSPVEAGEAAGGGTQAPENASSGEDGALLARLTEQLRGALPGAQSLARRMGGRSRPLADLPGDRQRALRRLSALYFLLTGLRPAARPSLPPREPISLSQALREQYLWEREWGRACLAGAGSARDGEVRELLEELARDSALRRRAIRDALERTGQGALRLD